MPQRGDQGVGSLITSPAAQPSVRSEDICTGCDAWGWKAEVDADAVERGLRATTSGLRGSAETVTFGVDRTFRAEPLPRAHAFATYKRARALLIIPLEATLPGLALFSRPSYQSAPRLASQWAGIS